MSTSKSTKKPHSVLKFISPFLRDILDKDQVTLHSIFKAFSYGQAGIAFAFVLDGLEKPDLVTSGFALLFPSFFVFGVFFGAMEGCKNKNQDFFSSLALCFLGCSAVNLILLAVLFASNSWYFGVAFILGIIATFHIIGNALKLFAELRDS